ncbi:MAG: DUF2304 domain-containing protein [Clostridia bacterium]|nr:DUF2304 domain-containing protein [Clostridia bacterium]
MTLTLRIVLIVASVLATAYALRKIRKAELNIDDAFYWIFFSAILLVMSIFPIIPIYLSNLLGIESPANFVFLFMLFILIVRLFTNSIELSVQKHRLNNLIQKIAIMNHEKDSEGKKD